MDQKDNSHAEKGEETLVEAVPTVSLDSSDLLTNEKTDQVLAAKMTVVNNAIDEIGFTPYHAKLFCLYGFGYAVDSLILLIQSIIATQAVFEFKPSYDTADVINRRFAFNVSLFISWIFTVVAGASPNWVMLGLFTCLSAFGSGGNLVLDTAVFLEYLPSRKQWLITLMAAWWGLGQLIAGLFAWAFMPRYSCADAEACTRDNNRGWRYVWYTSGAFVFVLSILRVTVVRLQETPKYLITEGKDKDVVHNLQGVAAKYNRSCTLTLERRQQLGIVHRPNAGRKSKRLALSEVWYHLRGLCATRRMGLSTTSIWFSWLLIGLAYPLFNVFLPSYLKSRGAKFGETSAYTTWRNYAITNMCTIFGPIIAGFMCRSRWFWGRRGRMVFGAITQSQNVGFTCTVSVCVNIYYGTLYAYTPEVLPASHRGTGNGIAVGLNRVMGIVSAVVGKEADANNHPRAHPICAALYLVMAIVAGAFPFEPLGRRSV